MKPEIVEQLKQVGTLVGWDALNEEHPERLKLNRMMDEEARAFSQAVYLTFKTPSGQVVLNRLIEMGLLQPLTQTGDDAYAVGERSGIQKLVINLLGEMEKGSQL